MCSKLFDPAADPPSIPPPEGVVSQPFCGWWMPAGEVPAAVWLQHGWPADERGQYARAVKEVEQSLFGFTLTGSALADGLVALYTQIPPLPYESWVKNQRPATAAAVYTSRGLAWTVGPAFVLANRDVPGFGPALMAHEADHLLASDPFIVSDAIRGITVKAKSKDGSMKRAPAGAFGAVPGIVNAVLDLYCDSSAGASRLGIDLDTLRRHREFCRCELLRVLGERGDGGATEAAARELLDRAKDGKLYDTARLAAVRIVLESLVFDAADDADEGEGGEGEGEGTGGGEGEGEGEGEGGGSGGGEGSIEDPLADVRPGGGGREDEDADEGEGNVEAAKEAAEQQLAAAAKMAGDSPLFDKFRSSAAPARRRWDEVVVRSLQRTAQQERSMARSYPPELYRRVLLPSRVPAPSASLLVVLDTSGSVVGDKPALATLLGEAVGIAATKGIDSLEFACVDCKVSSWASMDTRRVDRTAAVKLIESVDLSGGGGTSVLPAFIVAMDKGLRDVASVVYLTDGHVNPPPLSVIRKFRQTCMLAGGEIFWVITDPGSSLEEGVRGVKGRGRVLLAGDRHR